MSFIRWIFLKPSEIFSPSKNKGRLASCKTEGNLTTPSTGRGLAFMQCLLRSCWSFPSTSLIFIYEKTELLKDEYPRSLRWRFRQLCILKLFCFVENESLSCTDEALRNWINCSSRIRTFEDDHEIDGEFHYQKTHGHGNIRCFKDNRLCVCTSSLPYTDWHSCENPDIDQKDLKFRSVKCEPTKLSFSECAR